MLVMLLSVVAVAPEGAVLPLRVAACLADECCVCNAAQDRWAHIRGCGAARAGADVGAAAAAAAAAAIVAGDDPIASIDR